MIDDKDDASTHSRCLCRKTKWSIKMVLQTENVINSQFKKYFNKECVPNGTQVCGRGLCGKFFDKLFNRLTVVNFMSLVITTTNY